VQKNKILLVDDETTLTDVLCFTLISFGFDCITAKDGLEALEYLAVAEFQFDIVVSDIDMPNCTGLELLASIKLNSNRMNLRKDLPVILMSGSTDFDEEDVCPLGATAFIEKPFTTIELIKLIKKMFGDTESKRKHTE